LDVQPCEAKAAQQWQKQRHQLRWQPLQAKTNINDPPKGRQQRRWRRKQPVELLLPVTNH